MTRPLTKPAGLGLFFAPRSIAVLGASSDPDKIGGVPVALLKRAGFAGRIYPVNPSQPTIQGLDAYPSVSAIADEIDLAVIALPAKFAKQSTLDCLDKGARAIVMFSAGLGEISEEGRAVQSEIAALCRARGARLLGPNSLGLFSPIGGVFPTFSASLEHTWPRVGGVSIASQSGAVGSYCYAMLHDRGLGLARFIATGNEADIDVADCIDWLAEDPATKVIVGYVEGAKNGPALRAALLKARRAGKPCIMLKVGKTEAGAAAVASHTGSLAGSATAFEAVFAQAGVYEAQSVGEIADMAEAAAAGVAPRGKRLGVITPSGGIGVMLADQASEAGLVMETLPAPAQKEILDRVPFANASNPVDTTAQVVNDPGLMPRIHEIMGETGVCDILISFLSHMGRNATIMDRMMPTLEKVRRDHPHMVFIVATFTTPASKKRLQEAGFIVFDEPTQALRVAANMHRLWSPPGEDVAIDPGARIDAAACADEHAAQLALAERGIAFPPGGLARTEDEAREIAERVGFPVALKIVSAQIQHKSDMGGVALGLRSADEVGAAWRAIMAKGAAAAPQAHVEGCLVSSMVSGGVETVIGAYRDPVMGPVVMFGLGGVFIEIFKDVVFRPAPVDRAGAMAMIHAIKASELLTTGARGKPPADLEALADAIMRVSQIAAANADRLKSVELNPFIALPKGGVAVDALIIAEE